MEYQTSNQTYLQPRSDGIGAFGVNAGNNKNEQQVREFLKLLYGQQGTDGYLVLFTKEGSRSYFFSSQQLDDAVSKAVALSKTQDVYFGVGLQKEKLEGERGKAETVVTIPGLWLDVDIRGPNHDSPELPPDSKSARTVLDSCPLKPTLILSTGGGLHAYWLFREPLMLKSGADLEKAKTLSKKFQGIFLGAASSNGWKIDNTSSLAQVLRLPGTFNHKQAVPVPVQVIERNEDNRYTPAEIEVWLENASPIYGGHRDTTLTSIGGRLRGNGMEYEAILRELTGVNEERCKPPLGEQDVTKIARSVSHYEPNRAEKPSQAQRLVELAGRMVLFHTSDGQCYAEIEVNGHKEVWSLSSGGIREYLASLYHHEHSSVPGTQSVRNALDVLNGRAKFDSPVQKVHTRLAGLDDSIYLDLCNENWEVVEVNAHGWRVVKEYPVRFIRSNGMTALPIPELGGSFDALRQLINVGDDDTWMMLISWLFGCFNPTGPYPILILQGEQGSAKSTTAKILKQLIDPTIAPLRTLPRDERNLMIAAQNGRILAFDNLSGISHAMSDALCRLSTGSGYATRRLYADAEEVILDAMRPVMLNGIDDIATRNDLGDRCLIVNLPGIPDERRKLETDIWRELDVSRPKILGALLDAVSFALGNINNVKLRSIPRMADFAKWVVAGEPKLPWKSGAFLRSYEKNREESALICFESDNVAIVLRDYLETVKEWEGTAASLKKALEDHIRTNRTEDLALINDNAWPRRPNTLSGRISRIAPSLRKIGISVARGEGRAKRRWSFKVLGDDPTK